MSVALPTLIFLEIALYGADRVQVALLAAFVHLALLVLLLAFSGAMRAAVGEQQGLRLLYALFAGVVVAGLLQLAPWPTGMAKAGWVAAGAWPAITIDKFATVTELAKLLGLGAVFLMGFGIGRQPGRGERSLFVLMWIAVVYVAASIAYFLAWGTPGAEGRLRLGATLPNPNQAAALCAVLAVIATVTILRWIGRGPASRRGQNRWAINGLLLPGALLVASLWALALTESRGGALCGLAGMALAAVLCLGGSQTASGRQQGKRLMGAACILVAGVAIVFAGGVMPDRMLSLADGVSDRTANIEIYLSRLDLVPWTGFGMGTFNRFNNTIAASSDSTKLWQFGAMHNVFLQWIFEAGWAGALLMFTTVGAVIAGVARGFQRSTSAAGATALAVSAVLILHGLIDFDLQVPALAAVWSLLLGLGLGAAPVGGLSRRRRFPEGTDRPEIRRGPGSTLGV